MSAAGQGQNLTFATDREGTSAKPENQGQPVLVAKDVVVDYGGVHAVNRVSLSVAAGVCAGG